MDIKIYELTKELEKNEGANENVLSEFMAASGIKLPVEYLDFMRTSNGATGFVNENSYLILWSIEEILELNKGYEVAEFAPGLLLFGSSGGGSAYAFDTRSKEMPIVEVPFIGMSLDSATPCGVTFTDFLEYLYSSK